MVGWQAELGSALLHSQRGQHRLHRVIFTRFICAPQRHHRVADVLVDAPAVGIHQGIQARPQGIDHLRDIFGVHCLRHGRETGHIGKQYRDQFALLGARRRVQFGQLVAQGRNRGFHHGIPQDGALRFKADNGMFEQDAIRHKILFSWSEWWSANGFRHAAMVAIILPVVVIFFQVIISEAQV